MRYRDRFDYRPSWLDDRDWDSERKDDENPREDVQRARRRSMTMRMELRQQDEEKSDG